MVNALVMFGRLNVISTIFWGAFTLSIHVYAKRLTSIIDIKYIVDTILKNLKK